MSKFVMLMKTSEFYKYCQSRWKLIGLLMCLAICFSALIYYGFVNGEERYVKIGNSIIGVKRESAYEPVTIRVKANRGNEELEREITIKKSEARNNSKGGIGIGMSEKERMDVEITRLVKEMNDSTSLTLDLPKGLEDGTKLSWERTENKESWILPLMFPPFLMVFLYRGRVDKVKKDENKEQEQVLRELPSFNNKLVLLLGSGLVYEDSLRRIGTKDSTDKVLSRVVRNAVRESEQTNRDATKIISNYARDMKIGDLKRVTVIISDNRVKGTNLIPKLSMEGELLWEKRKKRAEEVSRGAESKLTLPLGIMMISILLITAGPALLQM